MAITHVVMDFGGVIMDFNYFYYYLKDLGNKRYGVTLSQELIDLVFETPGKNAEHGEVNIVDKFINEVHITDPIKRQALFNEIAVNGIAACDKLVPGVERLIRHLHSRGVHLAIATNTIRSHYELFEKNYGDFLPKHFSHAVCGADDPDVGSNKPAPDVFLVAIRRFAIQPESMQNVLIIEDSERGITGALKAGTKTMLINESGRRDLSHWADSVTAFITSFDEFKPESIGLPLYEVTN